MLKEKWQFTMLSYEDNSQATTALGTESKTKENKTSETSDGHRSASSLSCLRQEQLSAVTAAYLGVPQRRLPHIVSFGCPNYEEDVMIPK